MKKPVIGRTEVVFIVFSSALLICISTYLSIFAPLSLSDTWKEVKIPDGVTYRQGIGILREEGIIKDNFALLLLGRIAAIDRKLRAGYYNINTSMSTWGIFNRLRKGMIIEYTIIIPEGATLDNIKSKFMNTRLMDEESWNLTVDKNFLDSLKISAPSLEGYIYPDTYNLAKGMDPKNIFTIMVGRLRENLNGHLMQRAEELGMSENEVLILASIIEKEAMVDDERPSISAVYHNRLRKNLRLQADPTAIYGVKKTGYKITKSDLKRRTPYNTYAIKGLPPGPIASPGIKSIKAALYPADVEYIFFVSKNDGTHHFSVTPEEHLNAVMNYQQSKNNKEHNTKNEEKKIN